MKRVILTFVSVVALLAGQAVQTATAPYLKWLNEDVVYIITPEERSAFERLSSDDERQEFIEQFWLRRNPNPATARNTAKEEHYRRIAYANDRFAGSTPGWRTDRGRIYIQWGPPDEIESHPSGSISTAPFEIWRYRQLDGVGRNLSLTFVDRNRSGDYQVAPGPAR